MITENQFIFCDTQNRKRFSPRTHESRFVSGPARACKAPGSAAGGHPPSRPILIQVLSTKVCRATRNVGYGFGVTIMTRLALIRQSSPDISTLAGAFSMRGLSLPTPRRALAVCRGMYDAGPSQIRVFMTFAIPTEPDIDGGQKADLERD